MGFHQDTSDTRRKCLFLLVIAIKSKRGQKLSAPGGCPVVVSSTWVGIGVGVGVGVGVVVVGIRSGEIACMDFGSTTRSPNLLSSAASFKIVKTFSISTF